MASVSLIISIIGLALQSAVASAPCTVGQASACLTQQQTNLPSTADLPDYCVSAPVAVVNAQSCLNSCSMTSTAYTSFKQLVDNTCSATRGCSGITNMASDYYKCYDDYGGLDTILSAIVYGFNNRNTSVTYTNCNFLSWGRRCQRNYLTNCTYFPTIDTNYFLANDLLDMALYICGSEMVPVIKETATCSAAMAATVEATCGVACYLEANNDVIGYCMTLQWQVDCILNATAGCSSLQQQYLVPRLDSYAFANIVLGCAIQVQTVIIQPRDTTYCTYQDQLANCFNVNTLLSAFNLPMVKQLFDVDQPIDTYCNMLSSAAKYLETCSYSMDYCTLPQAQVYGATPTINGSYAVAMGPFPLNAWGLDTIFTWLNNQCPSSTSMYASLCTQPSTTPPTLPAAAVVAAKVTPTMSTQRQTPKARLTPAPTTGPNNGV